MEKEREERIEWETKRDGRIGWEKEREGRIGWERGRGNIHKVYKTEFLF